MISGIDNTALSQAAGLSTSSNQNGGGFDAALQAAQKAEASKLARQSDIDAIKEKGLTDWVRDTRIEKLKEELRKKIMANMGLDEDSLAQMGSMVQKILEQKIQDEVEKQLQQALKEEEQKSASGQSVAQQSANQTGKNEPGKNDRDGISCPVIPALAGAQGMIIF